MKLDELLYAEDGQTFERRSLPISPEDFAKTVIAFANTDGGTIVLGNFDTTKLIKDVPQDYDNTKLNEILRVPLDYCKPSIPVKTDWIEITDYKGTPSQLIVFRIEPSTKVYTNLSDEAYIRIGNKSSKLSFKDSFQLRYDKTSMFFEESAVDRAKLEDIDMDMITDYCNTICYDKSAIEFLRESNGYLVEKGGVFRPTVATILLFGKNPQKFFPNAKIRFIRYDGTEEKTGTEMNVIKYKEFSGTIKQQIDKAVDYIATQISEHTYLGPKGLFVTDLEYPEFVRQEIIVNAVCHRDYSIYGTDILVKMFSNRLVVESPGDLPGRVALDNMRHTHFSRNPRIAQFLKVFRYVKEFGEGIDRMYCELEASHPGGINFISYASMLRTTILNCKGHTHYENDRLEDKKIPDV